MFSSLRLDKPLCRQIYIACRANYGLPGGGLAVFDPATKESRVHRDEQQVRCKAGRSSPITLS